MKKFRLLSFAVLLVACSVFIYSCDDDDDDIPVAGNLSLNITGLQDLGDNYLYEGWIIVKGKAITTGTFSVNDKGELSKTSFTIATENLINASAFVLTIEPSPDPDPAPSKVHIIAGDIKDGKATLTVGHSSALGDDFTEATGKYLLATPTDALSNNELSGIWFEDNSGSSVVAGLTLPTLPEGWEYEGWVVIDGKPVTTGKFLKANEADQFNGYSGTLPAPSYPGEDFLQNAPEGLTFPLDLSGQKAVISVEPKPDNSADPFVLKPLLGDIPENAVDRTTYTMGNNAENTNPTGTLTYTIK
ncbi:MAG: hypothetical protein N4A37_04050 [Prolixibacteraceae bacterium]|jgi:hypothetical protein|nr:hypothetical protein [Prolixibacteraceae bacterium]